VVTLGKILFGLVGSKVTSSDGVDDNAAEGLDKGNVVGLCEGIDTAALGIIDKSELGEVLTPREGTDVKEILGLSDETILGYCDTTLTEGFKVGGLTVVVVGTSDRISVGWVEGIDVKFPSAPVDGMALGKRVAFRTGVLLGLENPEKVGFGEGSIEGTSLVRFLLMLGLILDSIVISPLGTSVASIEGAIDDSSDGFDEGLSALPWLGRSDGGSVSEKVKFDEGDWLGILLENVRGKRVGTIGRFIIGTSLGISDGRVYGSIDDTIGVMLGLLLGEYENVDGTPDAVLGSMDGNKPDIEVGIDVVKLRELIDGLKDELNSVGISEIIPEGSDGEGLSVGPLLPSGCKVGISDSLVVGTSVSVLGVVDGMSLGCSVGRDVGSNDKTENGSSVGSRVGMFVGSVTNVGLADGTSLTLSVVGSNDRGMGAIVGVSVVSTIDGFRVSAVVMFSAVGMSLGNSVEEGIEVADAMGGNVWVIIGCTVGLEAGGIVVFVLNVGGSVVMSLGCTVFSATGVSEMAVPDIVGELVNGAIEVIPDAVGTNDASVNAVVEGESVYNIVGSLVYNEDGSSVFKIVGTSVYSKVGSSVNKNVGYSVSNDDGKSVIAWFGEKDASPRVGVDE
jgi:hypothetical protein